MIASVKFIPGKVREGCVELSCLVDDLVTKDEKINAVVLVAWILNVIDETAKGSRAGG